MLSFLKRAAAPAPLSVKRVTEDFAISGQISVANVAELKEAGYETIICCRPDDESRGQPGIVDIKRAAEAAGVAFTAVPIRPGQATAEDVAAMAESIRTMPTPILAYCASGNRALGLYKAAESFEAEE